MLHRLLCKKKKSLVDETWFKKLLSFNKEIVQPNSFGGNILLREELQIDTINFNYENFECALYITSMSMPLIFDLIFIIERNTTIQNCVFMLLGVNTHWDKQVATLKGVLMILCNSPIATTIFFISCSEH